MQILSLNSEAQEIYTDEWAQIPSNAPSLAPVQKYLKYINQAITFYNERLYIMGGGPDQEKEESLPATKDILIYNFNNVNIPSPASSSSSLGFQLDHLQLFEKRGGAKAITIQSRNPVVDKNFDYSGIYIIGGYSNYSNVVVTPTDGPTGWPDHAGEYFNWKNNEFKPLPVKRSGSFINRAFFALMHVTTTLNCCLKLLGSQFTCGSPSSSASKTCSQKLDIIIVAGGYAKNTASPPTTSSAPSKSVQCLIIDQGISPKDSGFYLWYKLPDLPEPRVGCAGIAWRGKLWISGGYSTGASALDTTKVFDFNNPTWIDAGNLPKARVYHNMISSEQNVYLVGGCYATSGTSGAAWNCTQYIDNISTYSILMNSLEWNTEPAPSSSLCSNYDMKLVIISGPPSTWPPSPVAPASVQSASHMGIYISENGGYQWESMPEVEQSLAQLCKQKHTNWNANWYDCGTHDDAKGLWSSINAWIRESEINMTLTNQYSNKSSFFIKSNIFNLNPSQTYATKCRPGDWAYRVKNLNFISSACSLTGQYQVVISAGNSTTNIGLILLSNNHGVTWTAADLRDMISTGAPSSAVTPSSSFTPKSWKNFFYNVNWKDCAISENGKTILVVSSGYGNDVGSGGYVLSGYNSQKNPLSPPAWVWNCLKVPGLPAIIPQNPIIQFVSCAISGDGTTGFFASVGQVDLDANSLIYRADLISSILEKQQPYAIDVNAKIISANMDNFTNHNKIVTNYFGTLIAVLCERVIPDFQGGGNDFEQWMVHISRNAKADNPDWIQSKGTDPSSDEIYTDIDMSRNGQNIVVVGSISSQGRIFISSDCGQSWELRTQWSLWGGNQPVWKKIAIVKGSGLSGAPSSVPSNLCKHKIIPSLPTTPLPPTTVPGVYWMAPQEKSTCIYCAQITKGSCKTCDETENPAFVCPPISPSSTRNRIYSPFGYINNSSFSMDNNKNILEIGNAEDSSEGSQIRYFSQMGLAWTPTWSGYIYDSNTETNSLTGCALSAQTGDAVVVGLNKTCMIPHNYDEKTWSNDLCLKYSGFPIIYLNTGLTSTPRSKWHSVFREPQYDDNSCSAPSLNPGFILKNKINFSPTAMKNFEKIKPTDCAISDDGKIILVVSRILDEPYEGFQGNQSASYDKTFFTGTTKIYPIQNILILKISKTSGSLSSSTGDGPASPGTNYNIITMDEQYKTRDNTQPSKRNFFYPTNPYLAPRFSACAMNSTGNVMVAISNGKSLWSEVAGVSEWRKNDGWGDDAIWISEDAGDTWTSVDLKSSNNYKYPSNKNFAGSSDKNAWGVKMTSRDSIPSDQKGQGFQLNAGLGSSVAHVSGIAAQLAEVAWKGRVVGKTLSLPLNLGISAVETAIKVSSMQPDSSKWELTHQGKKLINKTKWGDVAVSSNGTLIAVICNKNVNLGLSGRLLIGYKSKTGAPRVWSWIEDITAQDQEAPASNGTQYDSLRIAPTDIFNNCKFTKVAISPDGKTISILSMRNKSYDEETSQVQIIVCRGDKTHTLWDVYVICPKGAGAWPDNANVGYEGSIFFPGESAPKPTPTPTPKPTPEPTHPPSLAPRWGSIAPMPMYCSTTSTKACTTNADCQTPASTPPLGTCSHGRWWHAATTTSNRLYVLGGCSDGDCAGDIGAGQGPLNTVISYTMVENKWIEYPYNMVYRRKRLAAATLYGTEGETVYAIGGVGCPADSRLPCARELSVLNSVEVIAPAGSPASSALHPRLAPASMIARRQGHSAAVLNGYIYVAGGASTMPDANNKKILSSVERFGGGADNWEPVDPMNKKRYLFSLIAMQGVTGTSSARMLIAAGGTTTGEMTDATASAEMLLCTQPPHHAPPASTASTSLCPGPSPSSSLGWVAIASLGTARYGCVGTAIAGRAYVLGGLSAQDITLTSVEVYTPIYKNTGWSGSWAIAPAMPNAGVLEGFAGGGGTNIVRGDSPKAPLPFFYVTGGKGENSAEGLGFDWHECDSGAAGGCDVCATCCHSSNSSPSGECEKCYWTSCVPSSSKL